VVGAHVGTIAVPLAKHCDHLIAVEANPWTYRLLKANIALNDVTNITTLNLAASDKEETIKFVMNTANSGGSKRLPRVHENMYFYDSPQIIDIEAHSLDEIIGSQEFALVFMDIEGSEYFALKGMKRILQSTPVLILEFIPHLLRNVAGVEPEEFAELLMPYFNELHVLSLNERVKKAEFSTTLRRMYDCDHSDMGLIFKK